MRYLMLCLAALLLSSTAMAGDGKHGHGQKVCCPACNYECEFSVVKEAEKKTCYDVECKPICIPPITFPWEKGCGGKGKGKDGGDCTPTSRRCGKVKVVRVMVKQEYECSRCKCKWSAVGPGKCDSKAHAEGSTEIEVPAPPADARMRHADPATPVINVGRAPAASAVKPASATESRHISRFFK